MVIYDGPSLFTGQPIVAILTGIDKASKNDKTGDMLQSWILAKDEAPNVLVREGRDEVICGDCRFSSGRGCYVRTGEAPLSVWRAYHRGAYDAIPGDLAAIATVGSGRAVRIGSYGDPAAVPVEIWESLASMARMHTGYSHAWRRLSDRRWRKLVMASVELPEDALRASLLGWRTFRVSDEADRLSCEMTCPASKEAGKRLSCESCHSCDGTETAGLSRKNVHIMLHGATSKRASRAIAAARYEAIQ